MVTCTRSSKVVLGDLDSHIVKGLDARHGVRDAGNVTAALTADTIKIRAE